MKLPVVSPWYAGGLQFECTACGNCCTGGPGYIWISDEEIGRLAEYLKQPLTEVLKTYCRKLHGKISLKEKAPNAKGEYDCIFLKEVPAEAGQVKRICSVYPVRPLQCRTWPFWSGNLGSKAAWDVAAKRCPGMNNGRKWKLKEIHERLGAKDWPAT